MADEKVVDLRLLDVQSMLGVGEILEHLKLLDPHVFSALMEDLPEEKDRTRTAVRTWLRKQYPCAYHALEGVEDTWVAAFTAAQRQREQLFAFYNLTRDQAEENFALRQQAAPDKDEVFMDSFDLQKKETWFTSKEPWSDLFRVEDLAGIPPPKHKQGLLFLEDRRRWKTIYHCSGLWAMEELAALVRRAGFEAVMCKVRALKSDFESQRYKVITTEPFESSAPKRRRK